MIDFPLLPHLTIEQTAIHPVYFNWIKEWLAENEELIEHRIVSSSRCIAGFISENILYGRPKTDWFGIMKEYLEKDNKLLAYSEEFGKKLFKFNQWIQSPIHAIYARWWIEHNLNSCKKDRAGIISNYIQPTGWIYNPKVSETQIRTRMKTELFMSLLMGCEILKSNNYCSIDQDNLIAAAISIPCTSYISAEYFRYRALDTLCATEQMVSGLDSVFTKCKVNSGFADFSLEDKFDDYMGSRKRTSRDQVIFSPITTLHAFSLGSSTGIDPNLINKWKDETREHLSNDPLNIPSFKMRDLVPNFGPRETIFEVLAAAKLLLL